MEIYIHYSLLFNEIDNVHAFIDLMLTMLQKSQESAPSRSTKEAILYDLQET